jgi:hypothetical protein
VDIFKNWPAEWPGQENHVCQHDVTAKQYNVFRALLERKAGEREIEEYLIGNREALSLCLSMFSTGHHASWIFPKRQIRSPSGSRSGLIPDYLMAGADSDGVKWFMLESKGADKRAFAKIGSHVSLSADANRGICQLINYIDSPSRDQSYLRDGLNLSSFREPRGILLIGTDTETDDARVRDFKNAWNRINARVQIRSYNALLRQIEQKLRSFDRI